MQFSRDSWFGSAHACCAEGKKQKGTRATSAINTHAGMMQPHEHVIKQPCCMQCGVPECPTLG
jgi:hypothetical protein